MQNINRRNNVLIPVSIKEYLLDLTDTLLEKDYYSNVEYADMLVDDILDFVYTIPEIPHYRLSPITQKRFNRYGKDLYYVFFRRKTSKHTTWYIFFSRRDDRYIIRYITNNHKDGKYIRNDFDETEE
ncbi:hypothetical protein [Parabacteroides sp. AF17-28]|uniref:hypothetical protein n=1 Tax=Parabacteroides sp. AF17-28 TaxID=2292241 RepID=UPI000EFEB559|nr:hypothetical protein [Parabacteroides sp. AF17-28]RHR62216.1 hypothetical protein DWW90_02070 [Parabacteroides sp. AF17-28]